MALGPDKGQRQEKSGKVTQFDIHKKFKSRVVGNLHHYTTVQ